LTISRTGEYWLMCAIPSFRFRFPSSLIALSHSARVRQKVSHVDVTTAAQQSCHWSVHLGQMAAHQFFLRENPHRLSGSPFLNRCAPSVFVASATNVNVRQPGESDINAVSNPPFARAVLSLLMASPVAALTNSAEEKPTPETSRIATEPSRRTLRLDRFMVIHHGA
jgi:hypothetical protein